MAWTQDVHGVETEALAELVDLGGRRVLEIGAGDGRLTFRYAGETAGVLALEPSAEAVADARAATPPKLAGVVRFEAQDVLDLDEPPVHEVALFSWSL